MKKTVAILSCISIMISSIINVGAVSDEMKIEEKKIFLYPVFTSLSERQDVPDGTDDIAIENKQYTLSENENALSVKFIFDNKKEKNDIMFVSIYDIDADHYITSPKGVAVAEECIFTGLASGHTYILKASTLFNEKTIDVVVSKLNIADDNTNSNILPQSTKSNSVSFNEITEELKELRIIDGYDDGSIRPENKITRAEVCAIINRTIKQGKSSMVTSYYGLSFDDVEENAWYYDDVIKSSDFGLINGYGDNTFKPQNDITYNEYIKMICSLLFCGSYAETNGGYPNGYMSAAENLGLVSGIYFNANEKITRKDAMIILHNALYVNIPVTEVYNIGNTHKYTASDISYIDFIK